MLSCHLLVKLYSNANPLISISKCKSALELFQINKNKLFMVPYNTWNFCLKSNFSGKYTFKTKYSGMSPFFIY